MKLLHTQNRFICYVICLIIYQASCYFATAEVDAKNVAGRVKKNKTDLNAINVAEL